jgi:hypothetical protein
MKKLKLFMIAAFLVAGVNFSSFAQLVTGGTLSADYRNGGYYVELAPKIGYQYSIFESGAAPFVSYDELRNDLFFGLQIYTQATIIHGLYLHGEFQAVNAHIISENNRQWVLGLPVGVGYKQKIADKTYANFSILYDFLYKDGFTPQKNPIIRAGITYSL